MSNDAGISPAPRGPCGGLTGLEDQAPRSWTSCHVPGLQLSCGSWGGVHLCLGRAPYLINPGTKVEGQESLEPDSSAAGCPVWERLSLEMAGGHVDLFLSISVFTPQ